VKKTTKKQKSKKVRRPTKKQKPVKVATIRFNLEDREGQLELARSLKSTDMALALFSLQELIRSKVKYGTSSDRKKYLEFRDKLLEVMNDYHINLDEILE
jgi:hypothetical protein